MKLAKVIGSVVATQKVSSLQHLKILMLQPLNHELAPAGEPLAAIDTLQAGTGDIVHFCIAREAAFVLPDPNVPVDAAITGIVDHVSLQSPTIHSPQSIFAADS